MGRGNPEDQSETEQGREARTTEARAQAAAVGIKRSQTIALLGSTPTRKFWKHDMRQPETGNEGGDLGIMGLVRRVGKKKRRGP